MKKYLLTFTALMTASTVYALDCSTPPSCPDLGYTKSASDCDGLDTLKCPFDLNQVFCMDADNTVTCAVGVNYNPTTKTCYNDGTIGNYIYISSSYYLDRTLTTSSTSTYSNLPAPTCSRGTPLMYADYNTLSSFFGQSGIWSGGCVLGALSSSKGLVYMLSADGTVSSALTSTSYGSQCSELSLISSGNYILPTVVSEQHAPYAFAALDSSAMEPQCICETEDTDGTCTSCPDGCSLSSGRCYGTPNAVECPDNCSTCDAFGMCSECDDGYTLLSNTCNKDIEVIGEYTIFCKVAI